VPFDFWTDPDLLDARHRKSAAALVALCRTLERRRPLGGRENEFLALYGRIVAAAAATFTRVWTEPRAYLWLRIAYQLLAVHLNGGALSPLAERTRLAYGAPDSAAALAAHLEGFKAICVAVACDSGDEWRFETPLRATLPFTVPAARWTLEGSGALAVHGVRAGRLEIALDGVRLDLPLDRLDARPLPIGPATLRPAVVARHGGAELVMAPAAFNIPGLEGREAVLAAGLGLQAEWRAPVEDALAALARLVPDQLERFAADMRHVVVKRKGEGPFTNVSHSELPGACITTPMANPLVLADLLLHEHQHNRLFALEERGPFFEPGSGAATDRRHYSPWRDDPRPMQGLLHALTVYVSSCRLWLRVYEARAATADELRYAEDRLLRIPRQLALASAVLAREAPFTEHGRAVFEALDRDRTALEAAIARLGLPADVPALAGRPDGTFEPLSSAEDGRALSAREAVREHVRLRDVRGQSADLAVA